MTAEQLFLASLAAVTLAAESVPVSSNQQMRLTYYSDWPNIRSAVQKNPQQEARIAEILSKMTLHEKIGQMIQPDMREITPQEVEEYKIGSILNGGGAWPANNKYSSASDWAQEAEKFYQAVERAYAGRGFRVPFAWATDAVHGHNNVFKATLYPHNIGLGAANNPDLIEEIGAATALEIAATGLDWTFAPTVAVPRDYRWGRVYEGYSEDPQITHSYASRMVRGLQGDLSQILAEDKVISTVKHWVGDGGTLKGVDRGENHLSEEHLINIHAPGYFSALEVGAQVVMTSFNSWHDPKNYDLMESGDYNYKLHGSKYIINDVLKGKLGFDGVVITDWNGHSEISGCSSGNCPQVILAGNDVVMVTARKDWKQFFANVVTQVEAGLIPMNRINDAVTRILRVKMRAGLWDKPSPAARRYAGEEGLLGLGSHRALARRAVRESLVLLKNNPDTLPLSSQSKFLVLGSGANDIQKQTGGWSLSWQGDENLIDRDFPGATTFLQAVQSVVGTGNVYTDLENAPQDAIALVVIGEDPYAEMMGDIKGSRTLEYAKIKRSYAADLELLRALKSSNRKVVTVMFSGRPLYVNEEIQLSDAFVVGWLPGTEAGGITDVLFEEFGYDFRGRLSFSWPATKCGTSINVVPSHIPNFERPEHEQDLNGEHAPLFPFGYGLSYDRDKSTDMGVNTNTIKLDLNEGACGISAAETATQPLELFGATADGDFEMVMSGAGNSWNPVKVSRGTKTSVPGVTSTPIDYKHQQDALLVEFDGKPAQIYVRMPEDQTIDARGYIRSGGHLLFDIDVISETPVELKLAMHCTWPCMGEISLSEYLPASKPPVDPTWKTIKIPLAKFDEEGADFLNLTSPFLIYSEHPVKFRLGCIRFQPD
jgi:beta-glucosidase